jgi:type IV fimbrial biogenesis protein FimT
MVELVIVMTIVAILLAISIPSYKYVTNGNRIAAEINGLLGDMQYARAEAIKEGQPVTVCVSTNGKTCSAGNVNWQNGWIVFADLNGDQVFTAATDTLLRVQTVFTSTDTFTANNSLAAVTFNREGFATGGPAVVAAGTLISLHANPVSTASTRCLAVTPVGLLTVQTYNQTNNGVTCL